MRLRGAGVRGLHCLILRGAERTIVRRWSPDTRINDRPFTDAVLLPGDRLALGGIELEVVGNATLGQTGAVSPAERQRVTDWLNTSS